MYFTVRYGLNNSTRVYKFVVTRFGDSVYSKLLHLVVVEVLGKKGDVRLAFHLNL
ncbi:MAG: hypothetical protein ACI8ZB_000234 [Desulforhopalus sp.]|jgi:hypothetical protein